VADVADVADSATSKVASHREADGTVLLTHWSPDKPRSTHDTSRIEIAQKLGYGDPERHAHYYTHRPLFPVKGMDGHELGGRRVSLESATVKPKYSHMPQIVVNAPAREFMLTFHLSTPEQPHSTPDEPHVPTGFGDLYFRPLV
jgi:hypothetical protein